MSHSFVINSAPKLQSIKIDVPLEYYIFIPFCQKIYENKNNIQKITTITLCVSQSLDSKNITNINDYKWIVDGVKTIKSLHMEHYYRVSMHA